MPIYCTANGTKSLKGYYHKDWNFVPVKTGDKLNIGDDSNLTFIEAAMLHWPDQMMVYFDKDKILFSSDAFGQHFASEFIFDDKISISELYYESLKYYANIVAPYSKRVIAKIDEMESLNLPISIVAPSHGILWRNNPRYIIDKYYEWAHEYKQNLISIIYDTMYGSTRRMAEALAAGIQQQNGNIRVKLFNLSTADNSDVITETFCSKAILVGSPTYNNGILNSIAAYLEELKGIKLPNKKAAAFGSYGWASASPKIISQMLAESGFEMFEPNFINANWNPTEENLNECMEFGFRFAEFCK
jgi:flavorubredoxin